MDFNISNNINRDVNINVGSTLLNTSNNNIDSEDNNLSKSDIKSESKYDNDNFFISKDDNLNMLDKNINKNSKKRKRKEKCKCCNIKLSILETEIVCRCGYKFCNKHRLPENHKCGYDYKIDGKEKIKHKNPKIINDKLNRI